MIALAIIKIISFGLQTDPSIQLSSLPVTVVIIIYIMEFIRKTVRAPFATGLVLSSAYEETNKWINDDIRPLPPHRRTWRAWTYISWWSVFMFSITNWQMGASLISLGLSVWQCMLLIVASRVVHGFLAVAGGMPGGQWHIGFPVVSRLVWGVYGSFLPIIMRLFIAVFAFAFNTWYGGLCTTAMLQAMSSSFNGLADRFPASSHITIQELIGWLVFNALMLPVLTIKPEGSPIVFTTFNAISVATLVAILVWSLVAADGAGPMLSQSTVAVGSFGWTVVKGLSTSLASMMAPMSSYSLGNGCHGAR